MFPKPTSDAVYKSYIYIYMKMKVTETMSTSRRSVSIKSMDISFQDVE